MYLEVQEKGFISFSLKRAIQQHVEAAADAHLEPCRPAVHSHEVGFYDCEGEEEGGEAAEDSRTVDEEFLVV